MNKKEIQKIIKLLDAPISDKARKPFCLKDILRMKKLLEDQQKKANNG